MPTLNTISVAQLGCLVGTLDAPIILDVRTDDNHASDPRLLPGSVRRNYQDVAAWAAGYAGKSVAVVCQRGRKLSQGTAAWLRHAGAKAETLEGGFEAWAAGGGLLVEPTHVPKRDALDRTSGLPAPAQKSTA